MLYEELCFRGFVKQVTNEVKVKEQLNNSQITYYAGFDPTADSLHIGSLIPIMALSHLQRNGHKPIIIVGGGTAMIGDPSGKTEMRKILSKDDIASNTQSIKEQLSNYIKFDNSEGIMLDNAEWILPLNYISFLRDIGVHFRVNEMIRSEGYRQRLEREVGLSFVEFNYQLLQAYDYLYLNGKYDCTLQLGGDDQWGNILAGTELTRRVNRREVQGLTFPLITTSSGAKMGKTASGAVWLSPDKTSPYDFYQYWMRTDDKDVIRFLKYFTFLDKEEISELEKLEGANIREAKAILAKEATTLCHGAEEVGKAINASMSLFVDANIISNDVPSTNLRREEIGQGLTIIKLFALSGLTSSNSDAIRTIKQGGAYINGERIEDTKYQICEDDIKDGCILLRKGKKSYHKITFEEV